MADMHDGHIESISSSEGGAKSESFKLTLSSRERKLLSLLVEQYLDNPNAKYESFKLGLSPREEEILNLLAAGYLNKQIAKCLYVTESTVKNHLRHIYKKLGVSNRTEAAMRALALRGYT